MRETIAGNAGIFQLKEDLNNPGTYLGTYAQEFGRESAGRIIEFNLPPGKNPEYRLNQDDSEDPGTIKPW
jgi:hypothetical protein